MTEEDMRKCLLPDWAVAVNEHHELLLHAQLCTRDGRRVGNGYIHNIEDHYKYGDKVYTVVTDKGNTLLLMEDEVHEMYWVGDYICKTNHNIVKEV